MSRLDKLLRMLEAEPEDAFTLYGVAQEYAKRGQDGDVGRAVEFYDRCIAADPSYCYAYYHKGRVQADAGETKAAVATLREGVAAARKAADGKALGELTSLLDSLT
ncbi:MAG TPA: tetratricopeptide repeat protein [Phycisphaerales bacterium]|nr:tetratricopeptide repeat protein [Phycisphaerales bacterium]